MELNPAGPFSRVCVASNKKLLLIHLPHIKTVTLVGMILPRPSKIQNTTTSTAYGVTTTVHAPCLMAVSRTANHDGGIHHLVGN